MHKIESSLSTRAPPGRVLRGERAWLRDRAMVPATSPAPVSTPINRTVRVGSERGGAILPTCARRPRPSARSERHQRGGVDEKMQKAKSIFADFLSREIFTSTYEPARPTWGAAVGRKCRSNIYATACRYIYSSIRKSATRTTRPDARELRGPAGYCWWQPTVQSVVRPPAAAGTVDRRWTAMADRPVGPPSAPAAARPRAATHLQL